MNSNPESTWEAYELFRMADDCPTTQEWLEYRSNMTEAHDDSEASHG